MPADTPVTAIVTLPDTKTHLNITSTAHDDELAGFIAAAAPIVEGIVGPVIPVMVDEWHDGGTAYVVLRVRPVLAVSTVEEFTGSSRYPLTVAGTPSASGTYGYSLDARGWLTRRAAGGTAIPFAGGEGSVHVVYQAGRASVPANIRLGTLELIRHWYQQTQQGGRPSLNGPSAFEDATEVSQGYAVPNRVVEMLQGRGGRRAPAIA